MDIRSPFSSDAQLSHLVQPAHGPLDNPASGAEATAVLGVSAGDHRLDASLSEHGAMKLRAVCPVALNPLWPAARPSPPASHSRDGVNKRNQLGDIVLVGPRQRGRERNAIRVGRDVMLASLSTAICGVATRFFPHAVRE